MNINGRRENAIFIAPNNAFKSKDEEDNFLYFIY